MTWAQFIIAIWLVGGGVWSIAATARDKDLSTASVTIAVMVILLWRVAMAFVLHAGGFW